MATLPGRFALRAGEFLHLCLVGQVVPGADVLHVAPALAADFVAFGSDGHAAITADDRERPFGALERMQHLEAVLAGIRQLGEFLLEERDGSSCLSDCLDLISRQQAFLLDLGHCVHPSREKKRTVTQPNGPRLTRATVASQELCYSIPVCKMLEISVLSPTLITGSQPWLIAFWSRRKPLKNGK